MELEDQRIWTEMNLDRVEMSELPSAYMWAIAKHDYISIIFSQGRHDETIAAIHHAKLECEQLGDTYFTRLFYQILAMIQAHNGEIAESRKMFEGLRAYAQKLNHDDVRLAEFYGNMGEYLFKTKPELSLDVFKESRVLFWQNLQQRGLKIVNVDDSIDVKTGSIKAQRIPDAEPKKEEQKAPVEEKKDPKQKGKADPKAEPVAEEDYSKIERVFKFDKEMNFEMFETDGVEANKINKHDNIYILGMDMLIKINLRYAEAL
mmetsp:Transcript_36010/g.41585  ORF Transcript_36010/g.41585 Transcript_36010/m.41585 type:complete len:261 (+) Transcript_36010:176-958(+)